jgi:DNA repair protein SbcC/Rad50
MIPLRISLKNFLCYHDQAFEFEDHHVWLLHGPNGVGKSAIFDGMVYALFGEHKRNDAIRSSVSDLIRRGENALRVEFDFEFSGHRYQIWRTRGKTGKLSQGVFKIVDGSKEAVRDVNNAKDLDSWVTTSLGFNYGTFVSAVLLRQGAADKLIDADKDDRRELFRGIIDLEPYIELHKRVNDAKNDLASLVKTLNAELLNKPGATPEELSISAAKRASSEVAWQGAVELQKIVTERLGAAHCWENFESVRQELVGKIEKAAQRSAAADALKDQFERFSLLRDLVPALSLVLTRRGELQSADAQLGKLVEEHSLAEGNRSRLSLSAEEERSKASDIGERLSESQRHQVELKAVCDNLRSEIDRASQAEILHRQLAERKVTLASFEVDLDSRLAQSMIEYAASRAASDALDHVEAMVLQRGEFKRSSEESRTAELSEAAASEKAERLNVAAVEAHRNANELEDSKATAQKQLTVAEERLAAAVRQRDDFSVATGDALCSVCRQPIDETHAKQEMLRCERAVASAATELEHCTRQLALLDEASTESRSAHKTFVAELDLAESAKVDAGRLRQQARKARDAAELAYNRAKAKLPEEFRTRASDIAEDGFPTTADTEVFRSLSLCLEDRESRKDDYSKTQRDRAETERAIETLTTATAAVGSPRDVSLAREDLVNKGIELTDLHEQELQLMREKAAAVLSEKAYRESIDAIGSEISQLTISVGGAEVTLKNCQADLLAASDAVPVSHRAQLDEGEAPLEALSRELQELQLAEVEREWEALANDRALIADWRSQMAEAEVQISRLPEEARRSVSELKPELTTAENAVKEMDALRLVSIEKLGSLKRQHEERAAVESRLVEAEKRLSHHKTLSDLLGDNGIQLDLVRQAEQRIVGLANDILIRVSSGDLSIEPPDPESDRAFELSVRRTGCPESIAAANLSGGQRFRLAVSLALAVCKFASGEKLPLESVIIDEGFGSLDREGRMAMISELRDGQELARMFKRVLVVSHQDDFASAFPVGYMLSSQGGTTIVESFDRR